MQGPKSKDLLTTLSGGVQVTEPMKNALNTLTFEGHEVKVAKTGYTGEPLGYEVYCRSEDAAWLWNRLVELGARPAGLGARDTLRMEAGFPLYGHEMGVDPRRAGDAHFRRAAGQVRRELCASEGGVHRPQGTGAAV